MAINKLKCDSDGVPELVQSMVYRRSDMTFKVRLFNGGKLSYCAEDVSPSIGLLQRSPTRMQMLEAENIITKHVLANWVDLFPIEYSRKLH